MSIVAGTRAVPIIADLVTEMNVQRMGSVPAANVWMDNV